MTDAPRPGRPLKGERRPARIAVQVRLLPEVVDALDKARGDLPRSEYVRRAVLARLEERR